MERSELIEILCKEKEKVVKFIPDEDFQKAIQDMPTDHLKRILELKIRQDYEPTPAERFRMGVLTGLATPYIMKKSITKV